MLVKISKTRQNTLLKRKKGTKYNRKEERERTLVRSFRYKRFLLSVKVKILIVKYTAVHI